MPIFEYNGKKYNVREEHIDSFMNLTKTNVKLTVPTISK